MAATARSGSRAGLLRTGRVYAPRQRGEGRRVLVMRLWPRGVRRADVDVWLPDLGAALPDLRAFRSGRIGWPEMRRRYLAGLARPEARASLAAVRDLLRRGPVALLCACADERRCHRSLLRARLARSRAATPARAAGAHQRRRDAPVRAPAGKRPDG